MCQIIEQKFSQIPDVTSRILTGKNAKIVILGFSVNTQFGEIIEKKPDCHLMQICSYWDTLLPRKIMSLRGLWCFRPNQECTGGDVQLMILQKFMEQSQRWSCFML